jgi:hypothetical protein
MPNLKILNTFKACGFAAPDEPITFA